MAELNRKDWVKDQTQTVGTGAVVLDGVAPSGGFVTYAAALTNGKRYRNVIYQSATGAIEVNEGVWTSATSTMSRDTVIWSTNANALVSFTAGIKEMWVGPTDRDFEVPDYATGTAIASAATINLDTATGGRVHVTGTTTITAITLTRGPRTVVFDASLTLTHHATNNKLPGGTNIVTQAGDIATYESDGATVYCTGYERANGQPVFPGGMQRSTRTANVALGYTDLGTQVDVTSGTFTQTTASAATLGAGWWVEYRNIGTGTITFTPGSGTVDGAASLTLYPGAMRTIECDGTNFWTTPQAMGQAVFTASGSFIVPSNISILIVDVIGGGGGGGGGSGASGGFSAGGGGGGGGAGRVMQIIDNPPAAGTSISVTVAAGGTGGAPALGATASAGAVGGTSSFGTYVSAFGGGYGAGGLYNFTSGNNNGGGGGGMVSAGGAPTAGLPSDSHGGSAGGTTTGGGVFSVYGGSGGGASLAGAAGAGNGGGSLFGPTGGGAGGMRDGTVPTGYLGGNGGTPGSSAPAGVVSSSTGAGAAGAAGTVSSVTNAGVGGTGGAASTSTGGGTGGAGGPAGGGGGGGGAGGGNAGGTGGAGGRGEVRVYWF